MPLEDLIDLGYDVRPFETDMPEVHGHTVVDGHGRQWYVRPDDDVEAIVAEATNHAALYTKLGQALDYFTGTYADWPTMTAGQKDTANRNAQRALANLIRHVRRDLSSGGI